MPLYNYLCPCGQVIEDLWKVADRPEEVTCPVCGQIALPMVTAPARTPGRWGDSTGYFNRGLGCYVENSMHRERICKERGLIPLEDFDTHFSEDFSEKQYNRDSGELKDFQKYNEKVAENIAKGQSEEDAQMDAIVDIYPADAMLAQAEGV